MSTCLGCLFNIMIVLTFAFFFGWSLTFKITGFLLAVFVLILIWAGIEDLRFWYVLRKYRNQRFSLRLPGGTEPWIVAIVVLIFIVLASIQGK